MKQDAWWKHAVIYEAYVDKFAGNFFSFLKKLDYLGRLGINCIHILPFFPSGGVDGGYDVTDYTAVDPKFGTLKDAEVFIAEARTRGIRVIIDLVLNHTSAAHPWFLEARRSPNSPKRDYYIWSATGKEYADAYNPFEHLKPRNWIYDEEAHSYYYATFYPEQPDLNWDNPAVAEEMFRVMDFWVGIDVSGFRIDAAPYLVKRDGTPCRHLLETHEVLKRIRRRIDAKYPDAVLLAEVHARAEIIASYFGSGDECRMAYNFPLMQQMYLALARSDSSIVRGAIEALPPIPETCQWATFLSSHDEITFSTMEEKEQAEVLALLDPEGRYAFKRGKSVSMRLAEIFRGKRERIIEAFRMLLTAPGAPVIYYGSEIGMRNAILPQTPRDTRLFLRGSFDWQEAERQMRDPDSIYSSLARMLHARASTAAY